MPTLGTNECQDLDQEPRGVISIYVRAGIRIADLVCIHILSTNLKKAVRSIVPYLPLYYVIIIYTESCTCDSSYAERLIFG